MHDTPATTEESLNPWTYVGERWDGRWAPCWIRRDENGRAEYRYGSCDERQDPWWARGEDCPTCKGSGHAIGLSHVRSIDYCPSCGGTGER